MRERKKIEDDFKKAVPMGMPAFEAASQRYCLLEVLLDIRDQLVSFATKVEEGKV